MFRNFSVFSSCLLCCRENDKKFVLLRRGHSFWSSDAYDWSKVTHTSWLGVAPSADLDIKRQQNTIGAGARSATHDPHLKYWPRLRSNVWPEDILLFPCWQVNNLDQLITGAPMVFVVGSVIATWVLIPLSAIFQEFRKKSGFVRN